MYAKSADEDPAMAKVRQLWEQKQADGWTQQRVGEAMRYAGDSARKSVNQFLKAPRPSNFDADAVGVALSTIVRE
jgi:hypothetical protein